MSRLLAPVLCFAAAGALGSAALSLASRGHPVALPLDDAYIAIQYARSAAEGHPFSYFPGEPVSAGWTSLLWLALLAPFAAARAEALPVFALLLDVAALAWTLWLAHRLASRHGAGAWGAAAAPLLCLASPIWLFGALNGMETGLYAACLLGGAWALSGGSALWLLPLALCRPEGAAIAAALFLWIAARRGRPGLWTTVLVGVAVVLTLALPWILVGGPGAATAAKALWLEPKTEVQDFYTDRLPYFAARALWFGLSGGKPQPALGVRDDVLRADAWPSWAWALFLGVGVLLAWVRRRGRGSSLLWAAVSLAALLVNAWDAHHYRYLVPAMPLLAVSAAAGWFGAPRVARTAGACLLAAALLGSLLTPHWPTFRRLYRGECERIASRQELTGAWIDASLPPEARVATHDVGVIAFRGRRAVVDLVGLVTPEMRGAYRHGEGALWEAVSSLPPERRPTHAAVVPAWMPYLAGTFWFDEPLWSASGKPPRGPKSQDFEVYRLSWPGEDPERWPGGDLGNLPLFVRSGNWEIADAVDVADLASESAHGYRTISSGETLVRDLGFAAGSRLHAIEGGRDASGETRFVLRVERGAPGVLVLRTASAAAGTVTVRLGEWSGELEIPRGETRFAEPFLHVPQEVLEAKAGGALSVRVAGGPRREFHWWLLRKPEGS